MASADVMAITKCSISDSETLPMEKAPLQLALRVTGVTRPQAPQSLAARQEAGG